MKALSIHSHKGGVGKSTICVNIATELAKRHRVLIIDNDLAGPSLQTYFRLNDKKYFNEYLVQNAELEDCVQEYKHDNLKGKLFYALSDPSSKSIDNILRIDKKLATLMLRQLVNMKKKLVGDLEIDYVIIDTSPGVNITAANAFVATDNILFVNKLSNADIDGSAIMIQAIMEYMDNKAFMVANQIPEEKVDSEEERKELIDLIERHLDRTIGSGHIKLVGVLPMDPNLQLIEYETAKMTMMGEVDTTENRSNRHIYALDDPDSEFSQQLRPIIKAVLG